MHELENWSSIITLNIVVYDNYDENPPYHIYDDNHDDDHHEDYHIYDDH